MDKSTKKVPKIEGYKKFLTTIIAIAAIVYITTLCFMDHTTEPFKMELYMFSMISVGGLAGGYSVTQSLIDKVKAKGVVNTENKN